MNYLIGIDIGTSGTKVSTFLDNGELIAQETSGYELYQPSVGWAEQNPDAWVNATVMCLRKIVDCNDIEINKIKGISFSGQMHGLVMLDEKYQVIRNSIIWCDQRTTEEMELMKHKVGNDLLLDITGNFASTSLTAAKILWVKANDCEAYDKCRYFLLPKDYVRFKMTGVIATEATDASGTQLMDLRKRTWSKEVCHNLNINMGLLPPILESTDKSGTITKEFAKKTGLVPGIPVIAGAADQPASAIGNGIIKEGLISDTLGSSGVVFAQVNNMTVDKYGRINTFCHAIPNTYCLMGVTQSTGLSMSWYVNNFYKETKHKYQQLNTDIMESDINKEIIYLPYLMGERTPHLNPNAKAVFFGMTGNSTRKDLARAVMEGISFSQLDALNIIRELNVESKSIKIGGGGANSEIWLQMLSDIFETTVESNVNNDTSVLGAAIIAGVGVGVFKDFDQAINQMVKTKDRKQPQHKNTILYHKKYKLYKQTYKNLKELM